MIPPESLRADTRMTGRPYLYNGTQTYPSGILDDDIHMKYPNLLVAPFCYYDTQETLLNITLAAKSIQAQFIFLVLQGEHPPHNPLHASYLFWWNQKLPQLDQYLSSNTHAYEKERFTPFFMIIPFWENHAFLSKLPSVLGMDEFSFDGVSAIKGSDLMARIVVYAILVFWISRWVCKGHTNEVRRPPSPRTDHNAQKPFRLKPFTSEDLGRGEIQSASSGEADCCAICLESMPTGTSVCVLPCRHAFHPLCMDSWLGSQELTWGGLNNTSSSYCCPLCKFDLRQHIVEHRAARQELSEMPQPTSMVVGLVRAWKCWGCAGQQQHLLLVHSQREGGDLELTVTDTQSTH
jgi:Ring finger domain